MGTRIPSMKISDADLEGLEFDTSGINPFDRTANPQGALMNGLSDFERFVAKNIFDTQPKRRASYLKRLGYEMSKDGERYRPIGMDGEFKPIEPDNRVLGFIPAYNLFKKEGWEELAKDAGDIGFDVAEGAFVGAASVLGAAELGVTGAAAGPVTGAIGATMGAVLGGSGAKLATETLKASIGELFLDEDVPIDIQELFYQSVTAGVISGIAKHGGEMIRNWSKMSAKSAQKALKEIAIRKSNGTWNQELADDFAVNPQNYTPEAVEGANKKLLDLQQTVFGTSVENPRSTRQLGGIAKQAVDPLHKQADAEIDRLANMPEANFSVEEMLGAFRSTIQNLTAKTFRTQSEDRALSFLKNEFQGLLKKTHIPRDTVLNNAENGVPFTQMGDDFFRELNFKEGREFLRRLQNAAFEEGPVKDNPTLKQIAGRLRSLADDKAGAVGSVLPDINAQRSEIMSTYQNMRQILNDTQFRSAFIGKDNLVKQRALEGFQEMDRVLGTNFTPAVQSSQFQAAVENLYKAPSAFGSGSVLADAAREGLKGTVKGAFAGGAIGSMAGVPQAGAVTGGALGFMRGAKQGAALASPESLVKSFSKIQSRIDDLAESPTLRQQVMRGARSPAAHLQSQIDESVASRDRAAAVAPEQAGQAVVPPAAPPVAPGPAPTPAQQPPIQPASMELTPDDLKDLEFDLSPLNP